MQHYFIIDFHHYLHIIHGANETTAKELFNDTHKVQADVCVEAIPCPHPNKFTTAALPAWMEYTDTPGSQLCYKCTAPKKPENEPYFFEHEKQFV